MNRVADWDRKRNFCGIRVTDPIGRHCERFFKRAAIHAVAQQGRWLWIATLPLVARNDSCRVVHHTSSSGGVMHFYRSRGVAPPRGRRTTGGPVRSIVRNNEDVNRSSNNIVALPHHPSSSGGVMRINVIWLRWRFTTRKRKP